MFDTIFGLPIHALVVHATVVLLPVSSVVVILAAFWPRFRRWIGWGPVALAVLGPILVFVTTQSGEKLRDRLGAQQLVATHQALGNIMIWWALGLLVAALAVFYLHRQVERSNKVPRWLPIVAVVAALVSGVGTLVHVYRVGDSGARAVWGSVIQQ